MFGRLKMIGGKAPEHFDRTADLNAFLGVGTEFEGKLTFTGTVRVEGKLKGQIFAKDVLIVGNNGYVEGEVEVDTIIIDGIVRGSIRAANKLIIAPTGRFYGNLETPTFIMEDGGVFEGSCRMEDIKTLLSTTKFTAADKDAGHLPIRVVERKSNGGTLN
jgi:cytoskeletal protein CcmA (bactofilin family)